MERKDFKWDIQANVSKITNEISSLNGDMLITDIVGGQVVNKVGSPANSFYGYVFDGVYSSTKQAKTEGLVNDKFVPYIGGDARFVDLSGPEGKADGIINQFDKTDLGSSMPDWFGGLYNTFTYKWWSLATYLNFVAGNEIFNFVRFKNEAMTGIENQSANVLNRWQNEGQITNVPRAIWNDPVGNSAFSSRWIEDGSYLRVQSIALSYRIPSKWLQFRNAEFYVSANNVLTLSNYLGYNPEFATSYLHAEQGIDYGQTPQPRQFVIGIKLGL
jgi:hypothetical protein